MKDIIDILPKAINENYLCKTEEDKLERARSIIETLIDQDIENKKILDFGCGEGHLTKVSKEYNVNFILGYDINIFSNEKGLTNSFEKILLNAPYDIIILNDVLDHLINETPIEVLNKIFKILSFNGKVYLRCHPFTSRHATHLYYDLNKAFIHILFSEEEIKKYLKKDIKIEKNIGIIRPLHEYRKLFENSGFIIENHREIREPIEEIFYQENISNKIKNNLNLTEFPKFQMEIEFIDYILSKPKFIKL